MLTDNFVVECELNYFLKIKCDHHSFTPVNKAESLWWRECRRLGTNGNKIKNKTNTKMVEGSELRLVVEGKTSA